MKKGEESLLLRSVGTLVTCDPSVGEGPLGILRDAAVLCRGSVIDYVGPLSGLPPITGEEPVTLDLDGHLVLPGLIDCHTHLLYAGDRIDDFEARLAGDSYAAIAARGGGILSTVRATRAASDDLLADLLFSRVEAAVAQGVTTIEVKSGYGLDFRQELRLLRVIERCKSQVLADLIPTFLGAHTLPVEARRSEEARVAYVEAVVEDMLPAVVDHELARFCDVFIEQGAFTIEEGRRVLEAAAELGLGLKVHAEQLSHTGAAELAAELGAVSAEHLEHVSDEGLAKMAASGTVAVLLPGASLFLRDAYTDAGRFRSAGVKMAVATDKNPGSSPISNLMLAAQLGVLCCGMTLPEALLGVTTHAATALGLDGQIGSIKPGMRADLALFRCRDPRELIYELGANLCAGVVKDGSYRKVDASRVAMVRAHT